MAKIRTDLRNRSGSVAPESAAAPPIILSYDYDALPPALGAVMQRAAMDIKRRLRNAVEDVLAIGRQLAEIRERAPHGAFEDWIEDELKISLRSARNFIYAYEYVQRQPVTKSAKFADLTVTALYLLAAPSTPAPARERIEARLLAGDVPSYSEVQKTISAYKEPAAPRRLPAPVDEPKRPAAAIISHPTHSDDSDVIDASYSVAPIEPEGDALATLRAFGELAQRLRAGIAAMGLDEPSAADNVTVLLPRSLAAKMLDGHLHRIFRSYFTGAECDQIVIALTSALQKGIPNER